MTRTIAVLACCIALAPAFARAQEPSFDDYQTPGITGSRVARNTIYLEALGSAVLYSINYERFLSDVVSLRLGGSLISLTASDTVTTESVSMVAVPITLSYLGLSSGDHAFELGGGATIVSFSARASDSGGTSAFGSASGVAGTAIAGYRYAPRAGGINFRAAFTPVFGSGGFVPWFGLAVGYGF
jgi:hypothetical protein